MKGFSHYHPISHLSISTLTSFSRCPRRCFYEKCGLTQSGISPPLFFGECLHVAIPFAWTEGLVRGMEVFTKIWNSKPVIPDDKRNPIRAQNMLFSFINTHTEGRSIYEMLPPQESNITYERRSPWEVPFAVDIGLTIPLVGYMDCLGKHRITDQIWPVDFKTSAEVSTRLFNAFDINAQGLCYAMVTKMLVPNGVTGMIIDILRVSNKNSETVTHLAFYDEPIIERFLEWARWKGTELLACESRENFPCDPSACTSYNQYGTPGYPCEYKTLCEQDDWTTQLQMFEIEPPRKFSPSTKEITE